MMETKSKGARRRAPVTIEQSTALDALIETDAGSDLVKAGSDRLEQITSAVVSWQSAIEKLQRLTAEVDETSAEIRRWREQVLPGLMDEAQITQLGVEGGQTLLRDEAVYASISVDNRTAAGLWMEKNGYAALVKVAIEMKFDKGNIEAVVRARKALTAAKIPFQEVSNIHPQTLVAFVRERLAAGKDLPKSITYHIQPIAKLVAPKKAKSRRE